MEYTFKTACPKCGKAKALKTVATVVGKYVSMNSPKCGKCGFKIG